MSMNSKSCLATAIGVTGGIALLLVDSLSKRGRQVIRIDQEMPAPASDVIDLIKQVEREPEMIPTISSVTVHERTPSEVIYTVRAMPPLPASVRYRKWWDDAAPAVYWESQRGTAGFHHRGEIHFTEHDGKSVAHLWSEHWITTPFVGRLATPAASPLLKNELAAWLKNLADELTGR